MAGIWLTWSMAALLTAPLAAQNDPQDEKLEPVSNSVTVVGQIQTETPASITVMGKPELQRIPGVNLDDRLRMIPGFSNFRRSSSLVANPTTQGVSLRGLGSSGASRTLLLWDGVPINDPFGGWIQWNRFSPDQIERVEVMRGASTSVFGDRAMSGAIAMTSLRTDRSRIYAGFDGGNLGQKLASAGFAQPFRNMGISANLRAFETDGYYIVPESVRGGVDTTADTRFISPDLRLDYFGTNQRFHLKGDVLVEDRDNGTVLQRNSTSLGTVSAHYSGGVTNNVSLLGYHTREEFRAAFSSILAGRNAENLTYRQTVPSEASGGAFLFRRGFSQANFTGGADLVRVEGYSIDALVPTGQRLGGGSQLQHGVFGQVDGTIGALRLFGGLRHHFAGQGNRFLSPSGGLIVGRNWIRGRLSAYRSFRAPTLNELFREFRVGNAVTQANGFLKPESSTGIDAGVDFIFESRRLGVTLFRNSLDDVITNVTLSSTPALIVRQRQNAAAALSRGVEIDYRQRWRGFFGDLSYLYVDSNFTSGRLMPQVPRHQGSFQLGYARAGTTVTGGVRSMASQFEDDLNQFLLPGYAVAQVVVRQRIGKGVSAQAVVENMLDRTFVVGFSPTPTIGSPRMFRLGLRWDGSLR